MKEIGSDKKRQRGYEALQQPPEKSSLRRGLTHRMLHGGTAISTSMSDARPRSASPLFISQITKSTSVSQVQQVKQQNTLSRICERESTDQTSGGKYYEKYGSPKISGYKYKLGTWCS